MDLTDFQKFIKNHPIESLDDINNLQIEINELLDDFDYASTE